MAEEVIRIQGSAEMESEPVKAAETMGTVISMKPAADIAEQQFSGETGSTEDKDVQARPEDLAGTVEFTEPESARGTGRTAESGSQAAAGADAYERPVGERQRDFSSEVQFTEPEFPKKDSEKEKKQIHDFFHFRKNIEDFTREDWILSRIPAEDLMEYLAIEQKRNEMLQKAKEVKEKRIFTTIQIALSMAAIVGVVWLLKDNPTVLVNILYITGIVIALWIWRGKQDK